jgi:hypothetical protein
MVLTVWNKLTSTCYNFNVQYYVVSKFNKKLTLWGLAIPGTCDLSEKKQFSQPVI